jgi:hypothetical protein
MEHPIDLQARAHERDNYHDLCEALGDLGVAERQGKHPRKAARLSRARVAVRGYDGFRFRRPPRLLALR